MNTTKAKYCNEKGVVAPLVAIMLSVLLGAVALAIDVGYMMNTRTELQRIADGAALAGARTLGRLYECNGDLVACAGPMPYEEQLTYEPDAAIIKQASMDVALQNQAGGSKTGITIIENEIVIGIWDPVKRPPPQDPLLANPTSPDAVRVTVRRDGNANGPITTFFARIFGINTVDVSATATAALTGESTIGPGGLPIPIGIPTRWFENPSFCGSSINFYPPCTKEPCDSAEGCAGYHTYTHDPSSASYIAKTIMPGIPDGSYVSPEINGPIEFNFTGGTLANLMNPPDYPFITLFNAMKVRNDGIMDKDTDSTTWTATVPVYESDTCANPNQSLKIVGLTTIVITEVVGSPNPTVKGYVKCDYVQMGRGGGGNYGTKGSIPGLVQ